MARFDDTQPYETDATRPYGHFDDPTVPARGEDSAHWPTPQPPAPPSRRVSPVVALSVAIVALLAALVALLWTAHATPPRTITAVVTTTTSHSPLPTATTVTNMTPTPVGPTICAQIATFAQAGSADAKSHHFALPFPIHSVSVLAGADTERNGYQHRTLHICTPQMNATTLQQTLNQQLVGAGWQATTPQQNANDADCGTLCWQLKTPPPIAGSLNTIMQFVSLTNTQTQGSVATGDLELTIAPFTGGTHTLDANDPLFSFDLAPTSDIQYVAPASVQLLDAALFAPLPNNSLDITYSQVLALDYTNNHGNPIKLTKNSTVALQGNGAHFSKFLVLNIDQSSITFQWVTYPFGF